jgi:hypothetical protein
MSVLDSQKVGWFINEYGVQIQKVEHQTVKSYHSAFDQMLAERDHGLAAGIATRSEEVITLKIRSRDLSSIVDQLRDIEQQARARKRIDMVDQAYREYMSVYYLTQVTG